MAYRSHKEQPVQCGRESRSDSPGVPSFGPQTDHRQAVPAEIPILTSTCVTGCPATIRSIGTRRPARGDPGVSVEHEGLPRSVGNLDNSTNNPEIFPVINKLVSQYS